MQFWEEISKQDETIVPDEEDNFSTMIIYQLSQLSIYYNAFKNSQLDCDSVLKLAQIARQIIMSPKVVGVPSKTLKQFTFTVLEILK